MAQGNVAQPRVRVRSGALKLVVFGMPGAGKTSLLGALAQTAQTQAGVLGGMLTERGDELAELRRQVYEGKPPRPAADVVVNSLLFQPDATFAAETGRSGALDVVLFDCDGRGANEFLGKRASLMHERDGRLAAALLQSDALLLAVDASSRTEILKRDFGQFISFLHLFQSSRSDRNEINGLPVYLVLTKCDLIVEEGDTPSGWMDKIEDRKRKVDQFFRAQLEKEGDEAPRPFGAIDLHIWATALRRPPLANVPGKPQEPYQVAELFRQALNAAIQFHRQRQQAQHKLQLTFGGALGVAALLALLLALFLVTREKPAAVQLENRIKLFQTTYNKNSPERFKQAAEAIPRLEEFEKDDAFPYMSVESKNWVTSERKQLQAYKEFNDQLRDTPDPVIVSTDEKLKTLKADLEKIAPPPNYAAAWQETPAVKLRKERLDEVQAITQTLVGLNARLDSVLTLAREVKKNLDNYEKLPVSQKLKEADKIIAKQEELRKLAADLPDRKRDKDYSIKGSERIKWAQILRYPEIERKYNEWEALEPAVKKPIL